MSSLPPAFPSARRWITLPNLVFTAVLCVGIFARLWEFPALPAGLNQDEASIGLEAYDLLRYGVDRNNISFPVNFISWGDGMDSLYGYLLIPFVGFGLNAFTIRLPVLLSGILSLPAVYVIGKRIYGVSFGLLAMFFLAISPWHIMMSRWGINENILPFLFLMAFTAILASTKHNGWFLAGSFLLGLCLYAYGASYVAVPVFLLCAIPLLLRYQAVSVRTAVLGVCIFCFVSIPIVLFLLVNTLRLPPLSIGPLTIPRLPMQPRYEFMGAMISSAPFAALKENFQTAVRLIMGEPDGLIWNAVPPYQYFYPGAYILSLLGAVLLLPSRVGEDGKTKGLMLAWLFAAFCMGLAQPANINRLHLLFIPLIFCTAIAVYFCFQYLRPFSYALIVPFLAGFLLFTGAYHGSEFRLLIGKEFFHGLIPALEFARSFDHQPICVTDTVNQPFVYVLFVEQWNPAAYTAPADTGREKPLLMDRYAFGPASCPALPEMIYIVSADEEFSAPGLYQEELFDNYIVYYPAEDG